MIGAIRMWLGVVLFIVWLSIVVFLVWVRWLVLRVVELLENPEIDGDDEYGGDDREQS